MKRYIYILSAIVALFASMLSCENKGNKEFLDDYSSILYFLKDGVQEQVLYRVGEPTTNSINISKGGSDLSADVTATVEVMTQAELDDYNTKNGTRFIILPENCYKILSGSTLNLGSNITYALLDIQYETSSIDKLGAENYVLPLKLVSETVVNPNKEVVLLKPRIEDALLYFDNSETNKITIADGATEVLEYKIQIMHNFKNYWNFDAIVGIDEALLDEFNKANGVNYLMIPNKAYSIGDGGKVGFNANTDYGNLDLMIDGTQLSYGNYLLPLSLLSVSKKEIVIDPLRKNNVYVLSYAPAEEKLSPIQLTTDMLSSNALEPNEGSLANLLDGDPETYFHSAYSVPVVGDHYLSVNLKKEITAFSFEFQTRHNNSGGNPAKILLQGSEDGVTFFNIETIEENLPTGTRQLYKSPVIVTAKTKHLRLVVPQNRGGGKYFVMSEFSIKGLK